MEDRKEKEIEYYDKNVKGNLSEKVDFEGFNPFLLSSYKFLKIILEDKGKSKKILDYGCGNGVHSIWLAEVASNLIGIDLSQNSLEIAKKRLENKGLEGKVNLLVMDCEELSFPNDSFDIIFDGGTFCSLDLKRAIAEISRVLTLDGSLIGIETLGHNPLTNFKRTLNKIFGKRTSWAASHIIKMQDLDEINKMFEKRELYFFHLTSWLAFPFLNLPGGKFLLRFLEEIDSFLLRIDFLKKYAFKIVFVFSGPQKNYGK